MLRRIRKLIARLSCKKYNAVSQRALSVYCDYVALDAVARNKHLLKENKSLEAAERTLFNVQLTKNLEVLTDFKTLEKQKLLVVEGDRVVYALDGIDAFPHEEIRHLNVIISGVTASPHSVAPRLTVSDDDTVEVEIIFFDVVSVFGILENFSGTIEQVKDMITCNHASLYFGFLIGAVDAETGQPIDHDGTAYTNYLEGSTFLIKSIKIEMKAVVPTLEGFIRYLEVALAEAEEDDLQNLSEASMNHYGLRKVAEEHEALSFDNQIRKFCRDTLNCVEVHWREGSFVCRLENGRRRLNPANGVAEWVCEPPESVATISLFSAHTIRISFAGVHWHWDTVRMRLAWERATACEFGPITAILQRDESWNEVDFENIDMPEYIRHRNIPPDSNISSNYHGPEPELTLRLVRLSIDLSNLCTIFDALGVDYTSVEDE